MKLFSLSVVASFVAIGALVNSPRVSAQPAISGVFPNGTYLFQAASALSFTANDTADITNVSVQITGTKFTTGQSFLEVLTTTGGGLNISGSANNETVSALLTSNVTYSVSIQVTDANGASAGTNFSFDTLAPAYTFEAEDFDFGGGQFIDNPQTNAYYGLTPEVGVDVNNVNFSAGGDAYARTNGMNTETTGDVPRAQYIGTGKTDYDVGWTTTGDWANYTRNYPPGTYYVYMRGSDGGGQASDSASMTVQSGTGSFAGTGPYTWSVPALGGWQIYSWVPLLDSSKNKAILIIPDSTSNVLQMAVDQGSYNVNCFMLIPTNANPSVIGGGVVGSYFPDGTNQFEQTNLFNCSVTGVNAGGIVVQLNGTNLAGQTSSAILTAGSGLNVTDTGTNLLLSFALNTNTTYSAFIEMTDANGNQSSTNILFDTVSPNYYTFEAEDFNYQNGQFFNNPQTNAYYDATDSGLYDGVSGVDFNCPGQTGFGYNRVGLNTENCGDVARLPYVGTGLDDYDVGNTAGGQWGNYSRNFPAGTYNIYLRASDGGNSGSDSASLDLVTSDPTQGSQTTLSLGTFGVPASGGWQKYNWVPLVNAGGYLATVTFDGSVKTLRLTVDNGSFNANYVMLVPANPNVQTPPYISSFQPSGTSVLFQFTNQLSFVAGSSAGLQQTNVVVILNGQNISSSLTFSGTPNNWSVTGPVPTNGYYTAIVRLTDANGTTASTNVFNTFDPNDYQLEAEDYDITNGVFIENQVGAYAGSGGLINVDVIESDVNASGRGFTYRANNGYDFPDTSSGDIARSQFVNAGKTDYSIGSFGGGSWANYTRHYPAGTYYVMGRFAEGAGPANATLSKLTSGYATASQATNFLGTFNVVNLGWSTWQWAQLVDNNGNPVKVTLDGSQTTLKMGGLGNNEVNVNFLMLVPTSPSPVLGAAMQGGNVGLSFFAQSGYNYQIQYTTSLANPVWTDLPSGLVTGDNTDHTVTDPLSGTGRFYRIHP